MTNRLLTPTTHLPVIQVGFFKEPSCCFRYTHVELRYSNYDVTSICRSPGRVHVVEGKRMSNPGYSCFFEIALSEEEEERMRHLTDWYVEEGIRFSLWNFHLGRLCPSDRVTVCSSYVCHLLQAGTGMCMDVNHRTLTPDALMKALVRERGRTVPSFNRYVV